MKRSEIKRRPLADTVLEKLRPEDKEFRELDSPGLYFRVKTDGSKSWQYRYKSPATGKWCWHGIGSFPEITGAAARNRASELRKAVADGIDPVEQKKASRAAAEAQRVHYFRDVALEWLEFKRAKGLAAGTLRQVELYLEKDILPALGDKPIDEISRKDCADLQDSLSDRGAHDIADKVRSWLNQIFGRAIGRGITENDPASRLVDVVKPAPAVTHYPHLMEAQLPDFLRALRSSTSRLPARTATWLTIWTASRPGMVRWAEWSEFDLDAAVWSIPAEKMKTRQPHIVPLSRQAVAVLVELRRVTGRGRYLFPGIGKSAVMSENTINKTLATIGYKGRMVGHGSRHTASTLLREHGWYKDHVEAQLAHKEGGIAGVYNKAKYLEQRRAMMQWYADYLDALADGMTPKQRQDFDKQVNGGGRHDG